jgi:cytochrome c biogenesis protein CcmG/thiol:disulfide interchange protein DsbE
MKKRLIICWALAVFMTAGVAFADEILPVLQVGSEVYSNVTVFNVSATDIYFTVNGGMANAKLRKLSPDLQKHFHFDATKAQEIESKQRESDTQFRASLANKKPAALPRNKQESRAFPVSKRESDEDLVVPKLYARSVRGQPAPQLFVEQWLTREPDRSGKFVLVDFWATWCGPCKRSIPHLNALQEKFRDKLVVIGLSNEPLEELRNPTLPKMNYFVGSDTQARTEGMLQVRGIPHTILIDPKGIVRFEGMPEYLDNKALERLLEKYSD